MHMCKLLSVMNKKKHIPVSSIVHHIFIIVSYDSQSYSSTFVSSSFKLRAAECESLPTWPLAGVSNLYKPNSYFFSPTKYNFYGVTKHILSSGKTDKSSLIPIIHFFMADFMSYIFKTTKNVLTFLHKENETISMTWMVHVKKANPRVLSPDIHLKK